MADTRAWYAAGLRFSCTGCGDCCRGTGYVWVDRSEIRAITELLGLELDRFGRRFLRRVGRRISLVEKRNGDCVFFDSGCSIYAVRPRQCRTYPFWSRCLENRDRWAATGAECEGVGEGRLYTLGEIERLRAGRGATAPPEEQGD